MVGDVSAHALKQRDFQVFFAIPKKGVYPLPKMPKALRNRTSLWFLTSEMTRIFAEKS
jgi:hypothetical protein